MVPPDYAAALADGRTAELKMVINATRLSTVITVVAGLFASFTLPAAFADQAEHLVLDHVEAELVDGHQSAEALAHGVQLEGRRLRHGSRGGAPP